MRKHHALPSCTFDYDVKRLGRNPTALKPLRNPLMRQVEVARHRRLTAPDTGNLGYVLKRSHLAS
jgi:hypothetical protein